MIDLKRLWLSVVRQCMLLQLNRSGVYYRPVAESEANLELVLLIDAQFLETPYYGARQMTRHLRRPGHDAGRKRARRLMARIGNIRICCGIWSSTGPTRCGVPTSLISRCTRAFSIW
ncbi:hypothetical protein S101450_00004 [Komagataeibacter saccharivorans]|nr:hypothetical protein S101450_00004 [Komagataeibacter saccharivorans]